ncbi:MAG: UPF0149 family protein [Rhodocyclaceae bacterium]|jgi:uncharacterized protein|nr:UPF0149 family protein [Rhodocyclaceae bacterium]MBK6907731.1 UPF0149 family protein [Rhodocyclaceae bacterium]
MIDGLSEDELNELDNFLSRDEMPDASMDPAMLDGFLTAIVIGPTTVLPSQWMPIIFGENDEQRVPWAGMAQMERINSLIFRHMNAIIEVLDQYPDDYEPLVYESDDEEPLPVIDEWCCGFVIGMELNKDAWQPLLDASEDNTLLMPILLYGSEAGREQLSASSELASRSLEFADALGDCVLGIREFWLPYRKRASTFRHESEPIARNDPCPCGSGKKFKKCCGAPERLH